MTKIEFNLTKNDLSNLETFIGAELVDNNWLNSETEDNYGDNRKIYLSVRKLVRQLRQIRRPDIYGTLI